MKYQQRLDLANLAEKAKTWSDKILSDSELSTQQDLPTSAA
jgi:hypothetical protein